MKNVKKIFLISLFGFISYYGFSQSNSVIEYYVSLSGSDNNQGTITSPFKSIDKTQLEIKQLDLSNNKNISKVIIWLREGYYFFPKPFIVTPENGGTPGTSIEYRAYKEENVVFSGGNPIGLPWVKESGNMWKVDLSDRKNQLGFIHELYLNGQRLHRASSPTYYTDGPEEIFQPIIKKNDFANLYSLKKNYTEAFCTFKYSGNDLSSLTKEELQNSELILYHSWECTWHEINDIDVNKHVLYLRSPVNMPIGFFSPHNIYKIENLKRFLQSGEWFWDNQKSILYYAANQGENPNSLNFIIPQNDQLLILKGNLGKKEFVYNISFFNINFQYTSYKMGINDFPADLIKSSQSVCPWLDYSTGYSSGQGAPDCGESILLMGARNCKFDSCKFAHLGSYGISIDMFSDNDSILNCQFTDLGGGGVLIGYLFRHPIEKAVPLEVIPSQNVVYNCKISNGGFVHPSAIGIMLLQTFNNIIAHNEISDFPYTGISVGWTWGFEKNYTYGNTIAYNHIHHVLTQLDDGGGIYTLGPQQETVIEGNYVHDINKSKLAIGADNNGIFFDEGSSLMTVRNNVVKSIENSDVRFNKTDASKLFLQENYFEKNNSLSQNNININEIIKNAGNIK